MGQYRGASNIDTQCSQFNIAFEVIRLSIQTVVTHPGSYIIAAYMAYVHRAVTLPFAWTHFTFILDFRRLKTSVSSWNLCFRTLNFWIEYLSCNDDLVSKISDHFPNVNYLKSPNW